MRKALFLLLLSLLSLLLLGCDLRDHTPRIFDTWGRGRLLGIASGPAEIGLLPAADGSGVTTLFPSRDGEEGPQSLRWIRLAEDGAVADDVVLDLPTIEPRELTLLPAPDGNTHVFWFEGFFAERRLNHTLVAPDGAIIGPQDTLTAPTGLRWYKAVAGDGYPRLFWLDNGGRLHAGTLTPDGFGPSQLLAEDVLTADFQHADDGTDHVAWSVQRNEQQRAFFYARLAAGATALTPAQQVGLFGVPVDAADGVLEGPVVALDESHLYVVWGRRRTTPAGTVSRPVYITAPLDSAAAETTFSEERVIGVLRQFPLRGEPRSGAFNYEALTPFSGDEIGVTAGIAAPQALAGQNEEVVLSFSMALRTRSRNGWQPTLVYLRDGELLGYQTLTWTELTTRRVRTAADDQGNLYTVWSDSNATPARYAIYLMTTQPAIQAAGNRLSSADLYLIFIDMIGRIGNGISLTFVAAAWPIASFAFVVLAFLFTEGELYDRRGYIVLIGSVLIYLLMKYTFLNDIIYYVPGVALLDPGLARTITMALPLALTLFASGVTYVTYLRRIGGDLSVMRAHLSIVLLDFTLSIMIYAIGRFE